MMSVKKTVNKKQEKQVIQQKSFNKLFLIVLVVIPVIIYFKSLNNNFTNWDDNFYITNNNDIRTLHGDSVSYTLKKTFTSYAVGNYHPLTMLTYCLEYEQAQLNPKLYHITNLVLHLFNTLLVFLFIWLLCKQQWVALITALLFAIHPMHVESVAWVSERKDMLYSVFYLAGLCTYLLYLQKEKNRNFFYSITVILFLLSCFSKGMAVSFSIVLLAVDYFLDRKFTVKTILEKTPFLLISLIFGYVAIQAQKSVSALGYVPFKDVFDRILFPCYGFIIYLFKIIAPVNLSAFYNYPVKTGGWYPLTVYLSPILIIVLAGLVYRSKRYGKDVLFGIAFFMLTIVLVLQIVPVGRAIIADRYTYLPYIGVFFIVARALNKLIEDQSGKVRSLKIAMLSVFVASAVIFIYLSFERCKVWNNSIVLWTDAIKKNPNEERLFSNRGESYFRSKEYDLAIADFDKAIALKNDNPPAYQSKAGIYFSKGEYDSALANYNYALKLVPGWLDCIRDRGKTYVFLNQYSKAIEDYTAVLNTSPNDDNIRLSRGNAYFNNKQYNEAIIDYSTIIQHHPTFPEVQLNRAKAYLQIGKYNEAIADYTSEITIHPQSIETYMARAKAYGALLNYEQAKNDFTAAIQLNSQLAEAYYNRGGTYFNMHQSKLALEDILKAKQLGFNVDPRFIEAIQTSMKNTEQ